MVFNNDTGYIPQLKQQKLKKVILVLQYITIIMFFLFLLFQVQYAANVILRIM